MINVNPLTQYPAIIPSAVFWYTADKQALGAVTSWTGQLYGTPATQGTVANQPINTANVINGRPAIVFDGSNDLLSAISTALNSNLFANGGTIAGVFRKTAVGVGPDSRGRIFDKTNVVVVDDATLSFEFVPIFSTTAGQWKTNNNTIALNQNYFFIVTYNGSSTANVPTIYLNSSTPQAITAVSTPVGTLSNDSANLSIGNAPTLNRPFKGSIAELMGFKSILSGTDLTTLITYFQNKYGL